MSINRPQNSKISLVLGGTGKTGRRVIERLTQGGLPVRNGSRSGQPPFDWEDPNTWQPALQDVASVYITYYPDLAFPGASDTIRSFCDLAVASGVRRLVLLSGRGEDRARFAEQAVENSGVEWTIVRASWFFQNFSEGYLLDSVLSGELALPAGNVAEPFIDVDDIADVATSALKEAQHVGQLYEVTGPRLLTFDEVAAEISKATGRQIRYQPVSAEEYKAALLAHDVPADFATPLVDLMTTVLDGRNAWLADGVQRALGRAPRDFSDYAGDMAASGVWSIS